MSSTKDDVSASKHDTPSVAQYESHSCRYSVYNLPSCHYHALNILFNTILRLEKLDVYSNSVCMKKICTPTVFHVKNLIALRKIVLDKRSPSFKISCPILFWRYI